MDARECLMTRRSVRKYTDQPIPDEILQEIVEAATMAPSSINLQHWYFVVVRSPEGMADLKATMAKVAVKLYPVLEERFAKNPEVIHETNNFMITLGNAQACVLAFLLKDYPNKHGALLSTAAATENLLLAAWNRGIASCWISAAHGSGYESELEERFAPGKGEFVAAVTLGYPDEQPRTPPRRDGRYTFA